MHRKHWSQAVGRGLIEQLTNEQRVDVGEAVIEFQDFMLGKIGARREEPTDDLLSALVNAELDSDDLEGAQVTGPRRLTDEELLITLMVLLAGGNHTTTALLGNLMVDLVTRPDVMRAVRADLDLLPNAIEETLRLSSPVVATYRRTNPGAAWRGANLARLEARVAFEELLTRLDDFEVTDLAHYEGWAMNSNDRIDLRFRKAQA